MRSSRKTYHHGNLRQSLIDKALEFLGSKGDAELSLRELAKVLGVSPNAPYRHFKDKDALIQAIASHGFHLLADKLKLLQADGPNRRYRELANSYIEFASSHSALYRVMMHRPTGEAFAECHALLTDCVRILIGEVTVNESVAHAATATWSLLHGYAVLSSNSDLESLTLDLSGDDLAKMLSKGIK